MNESLRRRARVSNKQQTVATWLAHATLQLKTHGIETARLDAELLLAHVLTKSRIWLHAHSDDPLSAHAIKVSDACLQLRSQHVPVAYIVGHKEFYKRIFRVTPATLVPRAESETIITLLRQFVTNSESLLDVGTGTGCLGITAKLEFPHLDVTLSDVSQAALSVATQNSRLLKADVNIIQSDLLAACPQSFDIIVANLPYVGHDWQTSPELAYEPSLALYATDGGLALILRLIDEAISHIKHCGYLLLEADPCQHDTIVSYAQARDYIHSVTQDYIVVLSRD